jgi:hypothetical protein
MERRTKERRKQDRSNSRDEALALLRQAKTHLSADKRYAHIANRIRDVIDEVQDVTVTLDKRTKSDRRDITAPRALRLVPA